MGKFITFEGPEGSGKSTQVALLEEFLKQKGIDVICTREPGGTEVAEEIREILVRGSKNKLDGITELLLLFAARRHHVANLIKPSLIANKWVICDRFIDSTFAYQASGYGISEEIIKNVKNLSIGDFNPDLTFILDIDVKKGIERSCESLEGKNRYEDMDFAFHTRVRDYFLKIGNIEKSRCKIIDASKDIKDVQSIILNTLQRDL